jgi:F-type H+-transporting ATPase subunit b
MKRGIRSLLLLCFSGIFLVCLAQESEGKKPEAFAERYELELKWANFLILAGGLGYLIRKHGGPFLADRAHKIRQDIAEAEEVRKDAERRAADVDRRLAGLESEIAALRAEAQKEGEAETQRIRQQTPV